MLLDSHYFMDKTTPPCIVAESMVHQDSALVELAVEDVVLMLVVLVQIAFGLM